MSPSPTPDQPHAPDLPAYDVIVVGGGAAGLSAAVILGRSRRSVLVIDAGQPRNAPADGVHAFLTRDGLPPGELLAIGREEAATYGVEHRVGTAVRAHRIGDRFHLGLEDGTTLFARRLVVTTGVVDDLPPVPGLAERWGRDVVHCPYCHGWEVRDRRIGVLATSEMALHQVGLFRQLSDQVVLLAHTGPAANPGQLADLAARGVEVVDGEVASVEADGDTLVGVRLTDGRHVPLDALAVAPHFAARSELLVDLGLEVADHPSGLGTSVPADATGRTEIAGVWVAGNITDPMAQVITAAAQGTRVGAQVNADLVAEDTTLARVSA